MTEYYNHVRRFRNTSPWVPLPKIEIELTSEFLRVPYMDTMFSQG
jgi:hypothetical protein